MNKHNPTSPVTSLGLSTQSPVDFSTLLETSAQSTGRLILLVSADADYGPVIQRIWQLATVTDRPVYLLGLCNDVTQELELRRQLIALTALLGNGGITTEAKIEFGTRWIETVRRNYQTGDILVCFAEQRDGLLHKQLKQVLEENLTVPLYILSGLSPQRSSVPKVLSLVLLWVGLLGIIAGAFVLQTRIMSMPRDWSQTTLMLLSVFAEFWLIWGWNNLFS